MAEDKIYWMPGVSKKKGENAGGRKSPRTGSPEESLFRFDGTGSGKLVFMEIERVEEDSLLDVLVKNSVDTVIDIRVNTVFSRPKFRHKNIIEYLYMRGIGYVEYNIAVQKCGSDGQVTKLERSISVALDRGLTLCLMDREAKKRERDKEVRRLVANMANFVAEVNARSLLGL